MSGGDCESCPWWDEIIKRATERLAAAPDLWTRRSAQVERERYIEMRAEHARSHEAQ
ncbi:hypothetical protein [Streptomyces huiliensis]|uniref:hypothetical protein n=1 Tax=Streptomyces huiliensis TaxID=2876027 RepID=UPI001CBCB01E|nr:hypothetical protein [Streptomyces huiliensis]MBZ4321603.1 hypothetical protein [Streptomyces huiliensis]